MTDRYTCRWCKRETMIVLLSAPEGGEDAEPITCPYCDARNREWASVEYLVSVGEDTPLSHEDRV